MRKVCVVIPIHSSNPTQYELISFVQCFKVLAHYQIVVVAPEGIDLSKYKEKVVTFTTIFIHPKWQSSLAGYNKLKLSRFFYRLFEEYDFLLTYELDAFIFKDDLEYWCHKDYDYIGAPWFEGFGLPKSSKIVGVGNSGFSLRKIRPIQKILKSIYYKNPLEYTREKKMLYMAHLKTPIRWIMNQLGENYTIQKNCQIYEDWFFSTVVPLKYPDFKIAPVEDAFKFSFEAKPEYLFQLNNNNLPMGCHAWWRYNLNFWKPYIEDFGYRL